MGAPDCPAPYPGDQHAEQEGSRNHRDAVDRPSRQDNGGKIDTLYTGKSPEAATLAAAVEGKEKGGLLSRMFGPRTIESVAKRRAWSRLSTPGIARSTVRFFTEKYRQPVAGGPSNVVGLVDEDAVKRAVEVSGRRLAGENAAQYAKRLAAEQTVVRLTARQFQRNGVALRQAFGILERGLAKRR